MACSTVSVSLSEVPSSRCPSGGVFEAAFSASALPCGDWTSADRFSRCRGWRVGVHKGCGFCPSVLWLPWNFGGSVP